MKLAICAGGATLDSPTDPRFGRCTHFVIVDTDDPDSIEKGFENPSVKAAGGAGIQTAQMLSDLGVSAVLTGNVGPNAIQTLNAAGIEVHTGISGSVRDAIDLFKSGKLESVRSATVRSHSGTRGRG